MTDAPLDYLDVAVEYLIAWWTANPAEWDATNVDGGLGSLHETRVRQWRAVDAATDGALGELVTHDAEDGHAVFVYGVAVGRMTKRERERK